LAFNKSPLGNLGVDLKKEAYETAFSNGARIAGSREGDIGAEFMNYLNMTAGHVDNF
jgi:hypothetical protein